MILEPCGSLKVCAMATIVSLVCLRFVFLLSYDLGGCLFHAGRSRGSPPKSIQTGAPTTSVVLSTSTDWRSELVGWDFRRPQARDRQRSCARQVPNADQLAFVVVVSSSYSRSRRQNVGEPKSRMFFSRLRTTFGTADAGTPGQDCSGQSYFWVGNTYHRRRLPGRLSLIQFDNQRPGGVSRGLQITCQYIWSSQGLESLRHS